MDAPLQTQTFIVRIGATAPGAYAGTVQRVRTGEKHRFQSVEALVTLMTRLAAGSDRAPAPTDRHESVPPPART